MRPFVSIAFLSISLMSSAFAADGASDPKPAPATPDKPAAAPAAAAPAAAPSDKKVVFGIITVADDHASITVDVKGVPLKLAITPDTDITIALKKADLDAVTKTEAVRVVYSGETAISIEQSAGGKKKKKKKM